MATTELQTVDDVGDESAAEVAFPSIDSLDELRGLTERERRFGEAFFEVALQHGDQGAGIVAYRRAFPLARCQNSTAYHMASQLLRQPRVVALISFLRAGLAARRIVPAERVVDEIERVALANILDFIEVDDSGVARVDLSRINSRTAAAISEVTVDERRLPNDVVQRRVKIKLHDKMTALRILAQVHKLDTTWSLEDLDRLIRELERGRHGGNDGRHLEHAAE